MVYHDQSDDQIECLSSNEEKKILYNMVTFLSYYRPIWPHVPSDILNDIIHLGMRGILYTVWWTYFRFEKINFHTFEYH